MSTVASSRSMTGCGMGELLPGTSYRACTREVTVRHAGSSAKKRGSLESITGIQSSSPLGGKSVWPFGFAAVFFVLATGQTAAHDLHQLHDVVEQAQKLQFSGAPLLEMTQHVGAKLGIIH